MTVQEVDPHKRELALKAVAASESSGRLAQAFLVLDTIALVRADLTRNDLSDAAEGVWRVFADLAMPSLPLSQQVLVFARVLPLVASTRIVPLAAEVWAESFALDLGSVKLEWDASERVIVFDDRLYSIVVTESGAIGGRTTPPAPKLRALPVVVPAVVESWRCPCGAWSSLLDGHSDEDRARFDQENTAHDCGEWGDAA